MEKIKAIFEVLKLLSDAKIDLVEAKFDDDTFRELKKEQYFKKEGKIGSFFGIKILNQENQLI